MVDLTGHETGNGGYSQRTPTALPDLLYSEWVLRFASRASNEESGFINGP